MRFRYSTIDLSQNEFDSLPRVSLILRHGDEQLEAVGLVDSGATVNVLPYEIGVRLGIHWDERAATIRLAGSLGNQVAIPVSVSAQLGDFSPVNLVFAWVRTTNIPLILGQTNFFMQFDVCFYRSQFEFEITPHRS